MGSKIALGVVLAAAAWAAGCGSGYVRSASAVTIDARTQSATLHFSPGRQLLRFRLHRRSGVILLYRLSAPSGIRVRGSAQVPGLTVPLLIATERTGPSSACLERGSRLVCSVGEEWCPMPPATWRFRVEKLGGPAGEVSLSFRVGQPPRRA